MNTAGWVNLLSLLTESTMVPITNRAKKKQTNKTNHYLELYDI